MGRENQQISLMGSYFIFVEFDLDRSMLKQRIDITVDRRLQMGPVKLGVVVDNLARDFLLLGSNGKIRHSYFHKLSHVY